MDNLFYRKEQKRFAPRALVKKVTGNKRLMLGLILGTMLGLYLLFGTHGILQRIQLQRQKTELEAKIHAAEAEGKSLQEESRALDSDKRAIEKVARERYGMVREGEKVYKVNRDK